MTQQYCLQQKKFLTFFSALFFACFYALLFAGFLPEEIILASQKQQDFLESYLLFFPLVFGMLGFIFSLVFFLFFRIFGKLGKVRMFVVFLLSYGFLFALGIDLFVFEPRDADFAKLFIETFSLPLLVSSGLVLVSALVCMCIPSKKS